ncbi:unnamed protein product [Discula destructiva]
MPVTSAYEEALSPGMALPRLQSALRAFQSSGKAFELINSTAQSTPRKCATLVILDSSFNPPSIAHLAMTTSALHDLRTQRAIAAKLKGGPHSDVDEDVRLLLLLAVNNADKAPKPATFEHRLLLMQYFAADIQRAWRDAYEGGDQGLPPPPPPPPVDIGLTTLPYFHDKSAAIAHAAAEYTFTPSSSEQVFLAGYDTLIRIFNPKYYTAAAAAAASSSDEATPMQAALDPFLARARLRITMRTDAEWGDREAQEGYAERLLRGDELQKVGGRREWANKVEMVEGLEGKDGMVLSSTEARAAVAKGDWLHLRNLVPQGVAGAIERGEVKW